MRVWLAEIGQTVAAVRAVERQSNSRDFRDVSVGCKHELPRFPKHLKFGIQAHG